MKTCGVSGAGVAELVDLVGKSNKTDLRTSPVGVSLDHLGLAVRSIERSRRFWEELGVSVSLVEEVGFEQVRVAMVPIGETRLELLEAMQEDSVIGRFVSKRGEGLHHVALKVDSLDARFAAMRAAGVRLASGAVRVGAGGHRYFFVHPASTGGVLVELVGD